MCVCEFSTLQHPPHRRKLSGDGTETVTFEIQSNRHNFVLLIFFVITNFIGNGLSLKIPDNPMFYTKNS